jgi:phosphatidate cytidylyltransferase
VTERKPTPATGIEQGRRNLLMRLAAGLVLAPLSIAIAYAGGWLWAVLVTLVIIGLYIEWLTIVGTRTFAVTWAGAAALTIAVYFLAAGQNKPALLCLGFGLVIVVLLSTERRLWAGAGFAYAALAGLTSILVRFDRVYGFAALIFVLLIVWATDTAGYFAGRGFGGAKLWPQVSPNKTWAGAVGGFVASLTVAIGFAFFNPARTVPLLLLGASLSIVAQLGDLFESAVKRRFGVKDSSRIIPGHGGLLDRLDGFVAAIVLAAILGFLRDGADGVGRGLMVW